MMERLTIDEEITHAREEEKRLRKIIETGYDGEISIEAMFCDDTEAIKEAYERFENCAKRHEQLAEWLEELKVLRLQNHLGRDESLIAGRKEGYNKAIDDFKKILTIEKIKEYAESDGFINLNNCNLMIYDIVEQLKEGVLNE